MVWQWAYSAFGDNKPTLAANRFADAEVALNAGVTNVAALEYNKRYDGQYFDVESGLNYNYFRSYKPDLGYTQNDPIGLLDGLNRKTPFENNPLRFSDPNGLQVKGVRNPLSLLEGGGGGAGNGGGVGLTLGMVGAGAGVWIGTNMTGPMFARPGNESRPSDASAGTKPIDSVGLGRQDVHDIKDGVQNGPKDWTGIAPNGDVIGSDPRGGTINHGPADQFTKRPTGLCK